LGTTNSELFVERMHIDDMKIINRAQIQNWDKYTIEHEPISSIDLMERASRQCADWILSRYVLNTPVYIFCGIGNNGGDGLAIARMLLGKGIPVKCYVCKFSETTTKDHNVNYRRLLDLNQKVYIITGAGDIPELRSGGIIIDAILGSGLNRSIEGWLAELVLSINQSDTLVVSIDMPSGLFCEDNRSNKLANVIQADHTLTFQVPKLSQLLPLTGKYCGSLHVVDIDLQKDYLKNVDSNLFYIGARMVQGLLKPRNKFDHKGKFGHAMIVAGSYGKLGASILATRATFRTGAGLVTAYIPRCGYEVLQSTVPEAMVEVNMGNDFFEGSFDHSTKTIGVGPGIGTKEETVEFLASLLNNTTSPMVLDADALNILSSYPELLRLLPEKSILTPHPKEFSRLVGDFSTDEEAIEKQLNFAKAHNCYLILKGANSRLAYPDGNLYFNSTGNPGMATAGSGDVLSGMILGLLARGYAPKEAAIVGIYLHGLAGDIASDKLGEESMMAGDIIDHIGGAFLSLKAL